MRAIATAAAATLLLSLAAIPSFALTVTGELRIDPDLPAGADSEGRVLLYTPKPVEPGSTHSHWDTAASPNLLMEPFISADLKATGIDLTKQAMQDMGWKAGKHFVEIDYTDAAETGFFDPDLGAARRAAVETAAEVWALFLGSDVKVNIEARFDDMPCSESGGTLASAGPRFAFKDFPRGTPGIWYAGPLAESLSGQNLSTNDDADPDAPDLRIRFNSGIDDACLGAGSGFDYSLTGRASSGRISFVSVALHELGHGLGFLGLVDNETGALFLDAPDIFTALTFDTRTEKYWSEMTDRQRRRSAKRSREVSFDGAKTTRRAKRFLEGSAIVEIFAPDRVAGIYLVATASFGPPLRERGLAGDLALARDGSANPTFACQPIVNAAEISGKIAVIDRGECLFTEKVKNAQDAGATAVIIIHNEPGDPPGLGGSDDSIRIPAVRIDQRSGRKIKRQLRK